MTHPTDRDDPQRQVPKPPSREGIETISREQRYITDEWTGDGGERPDKPPPKGKSDKG